MDSFESNFQRFKWNTGEAVADDDDRWDSYVYIYLLQVQCQFVNS